MTQLPFPAIPSATTKLPNLTIPTPVPSTLPVTVPIPSVQKMPLQKLSTRNSVENEDSSETSGIGSSDSGSPEIQNTHNNGSTDLTGSNLKSRDNGHNPVHGQSCCSPKSPAHSCSIPC